MMVFSVFLRRKSRRILLILLALIGINYFLHFETLFGSSESSYVPQVTIEVLEETDSSPSIGVIHDRLGQVIDKEFHESTVPQSVPLSYVPVKDGRKVEKRSWNEIPDSQGECLRQDQMLSASCHVTKTLCINQLRGPFLLENGIQGYSNLCIGDVVNFSNFTLPVVKRSDLNNLVDGDYVWYHPDTRAAIVHEYAWDHYTHALFNTILPLIVGSRIAHLASMGLANQTDFEEGSDKFNTWIVTSGGRRGLTLPMQAFNRHNLFWDKFHLMPNEPQFIAEPEMIPLLFPQLDTSSNVPWYLSTDTPTLCFASAHVGSADFCGICTPSKEYETETFPKAVKMIRERVFSYYGITPVPPPRYSEADKSDESKKPLAVIVLRKTTRKLLDPETVVESLKSNGYRVLQVRLEHLSFMDQVRLFSQCHLMVAVHGNALGNVLWLPPGAAVVELMAYQWQTDFFTRIIQKVPDIRFYFKWHCSIKSCVEEDDLKQDPKQRNILLGHLWDREVMTQLYTNKLWP